MNLVRVQKCRAKRADPLHQPTPSLTHRASLQRSSRDIEPPFQSGKAIPDLGLNTAASALVYLANCLKSKSIERVSGVA